MTLCRVFLTICLVLQRWLSTSMSLEYRRILTAMYGLCHVLVAVRSIRIFLLFMALLISSLRTYVARFWPIVAGLILVCLCRYCASIMLSCIKFCEIRFCLLGQIDYDVTCRSVNSKVRKALILALALIYHSTQSILR